MIIDEEGNPVTHPVNRGQMLRAPDVVKWLEAEQLEVKSHECNQTVQMTHSSLSELRGMGYEIISSTFAYTPKTLAKKGILVLDKRKVRWCPRGCDQVDSYDLPTYSATPG